MTITIVHEKIWSVGHMTAHAALSTGALLGACTEILFALFESATTVAMALKLGASAFMIFSIFST